MTTLNVVTGMDRQQWILNQCEIGKRIIDIGSNDGHIFNGTPFVKYVTNVDLDIYEIPNFYRMSADDLKFPDKTFDIALLAEILEHVEDPVKVLKEANRVAKRVLMTIPDEYNWDKAYFPFQTLDESCKIKNKTVDELAIEGNPTAKEFHTEDGYKHLFHCRYYKEDTLRHDLAEAGITDYKLELLQYNRWSFFVIDTNPLISAPAPEVTISPSNPNTQIEIPKGPIITLGSGPCDDELMGRLLHRLHSKGKLRIALISTPFFGVPPKKYGGLEQVIWDLAEGLDELGHIVTLFAPEGSRVPKHGSLVTTGPALDTVNVNWYNEEENRYFKWKEIITQDRFDIINDHTWFGFPYFHKMNNLRLRVIHTHHGGYQWTTAPPFPKSNLVAISKFMKQYTEQYFKQKGFPVESQYIYNGINIDKYPYQHSKTDNLLFVGRLSTFKQPHVAVNIARKTNHKLDIIGSASFVDSQDYVIQFEKSIEHDQSIMLHKDASPELKIDKMQNAKALIFPSNMGEPFGLVAVEAMACGTPVIALNDGAISEVVKHGVTGFICNNEQEMIEAISKIDTIKPEHCRKHVEENFSRQIMAKGYEKLYQRMMQDNNW